MFIKKKNWVNNSTFRSSFYIGYLPQKSSLIDLSFGYELYRNNFYFNLSNSSFFKFKKNFYFYFRVQNRYIRNDNYLFGGAYSIYNISKNTSNDIISKSGFGYMNDWVQVQISKDREEWGAGQDIALGLVNNGNPYDYLTIASNYGFLKVKYIHGILEQNLKDNFNRFIVARGLEYSNKRNFLLSVSEIVIYSGKDRGIDIGYLNPIGSHLEIELNNRLNIIDQAHANAIWQISSDFNYQNRIRLSFNYLFDEFVLDKDKDLKGKEHGRAYSYKLFFKLYSNQGKECSIFQHYILVGTPTFRHTIGYNNFVYKNKPLGWAFGSDGYEVATGIKYKSNHKDILLFEYKTIENGEETILSRSYDPFKDYIEGSFPSGKLEKLNIINFKYHFHFYQNFSCQSSMKIIFGKNKSHLRKLLEISLNYNLK
jgi:hypothetical protein